PGSGGVGAGAGGASGTGGAPGVGGGGGAVTGCRPGNAPTGALIADFTTGDATGAPVLAVGGTYTYASAGATNEPTQIVEGGRLRVKLNTPAAGAVGYAGLGIFFAD